MKRFNWTEKFPEMASRITSTGGLKEQLLQAAGNSIPNLENPLHPVNFAREVSEHFGLPILRSEFFTSRAPTQDFFQTWQSFYSWSSDCIPLGEWDGHLYVGFWCDLPEFPENLKVIPLVVNAMDLQQTWDAFHKSEISLPDLDPSTAISSFPPGLDSPLMGSAPVPIINKIEFPSDTDEKTMSVAIDEKTIAGPIEEVAVVAAVAENPKPIDAKPVEFSAESLESIKPNVPSAPVGDELVLLDDASSDDESKPASEEENSSAPELLQMGDVPIGGSSSPVNLTALPTPDVAAIAVEVPVVEEKTDIAKIAIPAAAVATTPKTKGTMLNSVLSAVPNELPKAASAPPPPPAKEPTIKIPLSVPAAIIPSQTVKKEIPTADISEKTEIKAVPKIIENFTAKPVEGFALATLLQKKGTSEAFIKSLQQICGTEYDKLSIFAIDEQGKRIYSMNDGLQIPLDEVNFFRLVQKTERPYHGQPHLNGWTKNFVDKVESGATPMTITVLPLYKDKTLLGFGYFSSKSKVHGLKVLNHISNDFQKATGTLLIGTAKAA